MSCLLSKRYLVGQRIHSGFSITSYENRKCLVDLIFKKHHFTLILGMLLYYFDGCAGSSLLRGLSLVAECRLLPVAASLVAETGSGAAAHRLSYSSACGVFLDGGLNSCLLHWRVDSLPLSHEGSAVNLILTNQLIKAKNNF